MKLLPFIVVASAMSLGTLPAWSQYVKGNAAVTSSSNGSRQVQTPPLPSTGPLRGSKPCAANAGCNAGPWHMVETPEGLRECTEAYARAGTCRESTYGHKKMSRLWVVRVGSKWLQCQYPDIGSKCVDMFAPPPSNLPFDAVQ